MLRIKIVAITFCFMFISLASVYARPDVQSTEGTFAHGSTITVLGSGFGAKSTAIPLIWDDGSARADGDDPDNQGNWDIAKPRYCTDTQYNIQYRTGPFRNVSHPHGRGNAKMIVGCHANEGYSPWNASKGPNVYMAKTISSGTQNFYLSYYYRLDPLWPPNNGESVGSPNHKMNGFEADPGGFDETCTNYIEYRPEIENSVAAFHTMGMDMSSYYPGEQEGRYAEEPWNWVKIEIIGVNINNSTSGKLYIKTNNDLDYVRENMDVYGSSGPVYAISVGYYWTRCNNCPTVGSNDAFRYFADVYIDTTPQRVVLANNANYDTATIIEPQIPTGWNSSGNSIACRVNLGRLPNSGTAYLFVFDANNDHNPTGYPVTIGGGGAPPENPPSAPTGLTIINNQ